MQSFFMMSTSYSVGFFQFCRKYYSYNYKISHIVQQTTSPTCKLCKLCTTLYFAFLMLLSCCIGSGCNLIHIWHSSSHRLLVVSSCMYSVHVILGVSSFVPGVLESNTWGCSYRSSSCQSSSEWCSN